MEPDSTSAPWPRMMALVSMLGTVAVPVIVLIATNMYTSAMKESENLHAVAMKESENRIKYIEIAVGVLREDPTKQGPAFRKWAVDVLAKSSSGIVELSPEAQKQLLEQRALIDYGTYTSSLNFGTWDTGSYPKRPATKGK